MYIIFGYSLFSLLAPKKKKKKKKKKKSLLSLSYFSIVIAKIQKRISSLISPI